MQYRRRGLVAVIATVLLVVAVPSAAQAWTVTVRVHGAGGVIEVPNRFGENLNMTNCTISPDGRTESSESNCVGGTANGLYNSGNVVRLAPLLPTDGAAYIRGWRFSKWVDGTGSGQINCDPQETTGNQFSPTYCEFQIFANLYVDLYFTDNFGPEDTSLSGGPTGIVSSSSATFNFNAASDPEASFECRLDRPGQTGSYLPCGNSGDKSETYSDLFTDGTYTFYVRGKDWEGKPDPTPVSRTWTVDRTGPTVSITNGPADGGSTSQTQPTFTFTAGETATYECSVDGGPYTGCTSPYQVPTPLAETAHTFAVRAYDTLNNPGGATTRSFTVDVTPPQTTLLTGPGEGTTTPSRSTTFTFASPESSMQFECRIDDEAFAPCTSPYTRELDNGDHAFEVRAKDAAGNVDATPERRTWRVNSLDDDADGYNRPQDCNDADPAIHPGANDVAGNGVDEDCDGADRPVPVDSDVDRDGVAVPLDCNDTNPAIYPGAADAPGNGVDENCDGADAAFAIVSASLRHFWLWRGSRTWATTLKLSGVTPGAVVTFSCKGRGCPFKSRRLKPRANGTLDLAKVLKKRKLAKGALLTIRISAVGMTATVVTFRMRRGKAPSGGKFLCQAPGAAKPSPC